MSGFNNKAEANTVWYINTHRVEVPVKPDVLSALSMQLTELKNNAAEFFTAAKCSISNVANKFGDWVKRVFIYTDFRSSDAGKPADSLLPEKTESLKQQLAKLYELAQPDLIKTYNKRLLNQIDVLGKKIESKTQISKSELTDISMNDDPGLRHIMTALRGIKDFQDQPLLSDNAKNIYEIKLKFDGLKEDVEFSQLGSVGDDSPVMTAVDNKNFTKEFKSQITEIFSQIRENIIPPLALLASGSPVISAEMQHDGENQ